MKPTIPISQFRESEGLVFTSGQVYLTSEGKLLEGTIQEQTHQVMKNLEAVMSSAGVMFADVLKATIYVTDMNIASDVNAVYGSYFSEPYPAREMICVKALPLGAQLEISLVAVKR